MRKLLGRKGFQFVKGQIARKEYHILYFKSGPWTLLSSLCCLIPGFELNCKPLSYTQSDLSETVLKTRPLLYLKQVRGSALPSA